MLKILRNLANRMNATVEYRLGTNLDFIRSLMGHHREKIALRMVSRDGFRDVSFQDLKEAAETVADFFIGAGIEKDTRIAILCENRPERAIGFFGIISAACVAVPIDSKLSIQEIIFILNDSCAVCAVVSDATAGIVLSHREKLPHLKLILSVDDTRESSMVSVNRLLAQKSERKTRPGGGLDETAIIIYTSGTTGVSKGVELNYRGLLYEVETLVRSIGISENDSFVSVLPLSHMLEITGGLLSPLYAGSTVTYCGTLRADVLMETIRKSSATMMISVPAVLKGFRNAIFRMAERQPIIKRKIFKGFFYLSRFLMRMGIRSGRFLFPQVHRKFGGRFWCFVSGGAPLDIGLEEDLEALGFCILQGYGLTEASPVVSVNTPKKKKRGSVGTPLKGISVRILKQSPSDGEGEIVITGPNIMKGYFNNPEATKGVLKNGWLHTGDIGYFDRGGFLHISGRIKNMIVLEDGRKVFPEELEHTLGRSPYIKEICAFGKKPLQKPADKGEEVVAVIVPNLDMFSENERCDEMKIREKISQEIAIFSQNLAGYKRIKNFILHFDELPKTATRKIKRSDVKRLAESIIARLEK